MASMLANTTVNVTQVLAIADRCPCSISTTLEDCLSMRTITCLANMLSIDSAPECSLAEAVSQDSNRKGKRTRGRMDTFKSHKCVSLKLASASNWWDCSNAIPACQFPGYCSTDAPAPIAQTRVLVSFPILWKYAVSRRAR